MKKLESFFNKLSFRGQEAQESREDAGREYLAESLEARVLYSGTVAPDAPVDEEVVHEAPAENEPEAIGADGSPVSAIEAAQQASAEMEQFVSEGIQIAGGESDIPEDQGVVILNPEVFGDLGAISQAAAEGAFDAAAERWSVSGVLTDDQEAALGDVSVQVADLEGDLLVIVSDDNSTILLDIDAAGRAWFVDGTPLDDSEFTDRVSLNGFRAESGNATQGVDVLTILMEAQGSLFGVDGVSAGRDVSATGLEEGLRRIPIADEALTNPDEVTTSLVADLANAAAQRWEESGLSGAQLEALVNIEYRVVDLQSGIIGSAEDGVISIDIDAAGKGWFVDLSPEEDEEFGVQNSATSLSATEGSAAGGIDLLSVILHEQGHVLGLEHVEDSESVTVMTDVFSEGDRRILLGGQAEGAVAGSLEGEHFATIAYWQLDESSGNLADVVTSDGAAQTLTGASGLNYSQGALVSPVSNPQAEADSSNPGSIDFNGTSNAPRITGAGNDPFELLGTSSFTFEGWLQHNISDGTHSGIEQIAGDRHVSDYKGWALWLNSGKLTFYYDMGTPRISTTSTTRLDDGNAHHFAAVWDHDAPGSGTDPAGVLRVYIDGVEEGVMGGDTGATRTYGTSDAPFAIGARNTSGGTFNDSAFNGRLDELRFSDVALAPSEFLNAPDSTAPTISSLSPADDAPGVSPVTNLVATFDEPIALKSGGTITITDTDDGSGTQVIDLLDATSATVSGNDLIINPAIALEPNTSYEIVIDENAIEDLAPSPNGYSGTASGEWTFTTGTVPAVLVDLNADNTNRDANTGEFEDAAGLASGTFGGDPVTDFDLGSGNIMSGTLILDSTEDDIRIQANSSAFSVAGDADGWFGGGSSPNNLLEDGIFMRNASGDPSGTITLSGSGLELNSNRRYELYLMAGRTQGHETTFTFDVNNPSDPSGGVAIHTSAPVVNGNETLGTAMFTFNTDSTVPSSLVIQWDGQQHNTGNQDAVFSGFALRDVGAANTSPETALSAADDDYTGIPADEDTVLSVPTATADEVSITLGANATTDLGAGIINLKDAEGANNPFTWTNPGGGGFDIKLTADNITSNNDPGAIIGRIASGNDVTLEFFETGTTNPVDVSGLKLTFGDIDPVSGETAEVSDLSITSAAGVRQEVAVDAVFTLPTGLSAVDTNGSGVKDGIKSSQSVSGQNFNAANTGLLDLSDASFHRLSFTVNNEFVVIGNTDVSSLEMSDGILANDNFSTTGGHIVGIQGTDSLTGTSDKGAAVAVEPDGSFTYDPRASDELQALAAGESTTDQFTYTIEETLPVSSGLALWLDASDINGDGTNHSFNDGDIFGNQISQWTDKSGNDRHLDSVMTGDPSYVASSSLNGRPVVNFDGNDRLAMTQNLDALDGYTIFAVERKTDGTDGRVVSSESRNWLFGHHGDDEGEWYAEGWINKDTAPESTNWNLFTGTMTADGDPVASMWQNGARLTLDDAKGSGSGNNDPGQLALGGYSGGQMTRSEVAEVIIYDSVLSEEDRLAVEAYLNNKYFSEQALLIDFSESSDPPLQSGYEGFSLGRDGPGTTTRMYTNSLGVGGTVNVEVAGATHSRDYAAITAGGPFSSRSNLLSDSALRNASGTMTLTLRDLKAGQYEITTYHHDTSATLGGTFDVGLKVGSAAAQSVASNVQNSDGTSPSSITTLVTTFTVENDSDEVKLDFTRDAGGGHLNLNGFALAKASTATVTVTVTGTNTPPTLTATAADPTYTENDSNTPVNLFSNTAISTVESGQDIASITLTVAGLESGDTEKLVIDGADVALVDSTTVTTTNGTIDVSVSGSTATVTITGNSLTANAAETLVDAIAYKNEGDDPTDGDRTVTLTAITDSGSNTAPNVNSTTLSIASTVNVDPVNDAPEISSTLIGHWKFDEGTGTMTADSSDNSNTATAAGAAGSWVTGKSGGGYQLGGGNSRFEVDDSSDLRVTGAVTVSAWVNPTDESHFGLIAGIDQTGGTGSDMFTLKTSSSGTDKLRWDVVGPGTNVSLDSTSDFYGALGNGSDGWVHVVGVYDPANSFAGLYVNGQLDKSTGTVPTSIQSTMTDFQIGHNASDSGSNPLRAAVDDVQVYDQALSADDIAFLFGNPGSTLPAILTETDDPLKTSGTLNVEDIDSADMVSASITAVSVGGTGTATSGAGAAATIGGREISNAELIDMMTPNVATQVIDGNNTTGTISWAFDSGSEAFNELAEGKTLELTYTVTASDDSGATNDTATETVTITISGTNDQPEITPVPLGFYGAENNTQDSSGNGNHGTANGSGFSYSTSVPSAISDRSTRSFNLTGDSGDDHLLLPTDFTGTAQSTGASLSLWVQTASGIGSDYVFSAGNSGNNTPIYGIQGNPSADSKMRVFYRNDAGDTASATGSATVFGNGWHHLVLTDDGTTARVYVDGSSIPDIELEYPTGAMTVDRNAIGALIRYSNFGYLAGQIDEVAFFDEVLTTADIAALYGGADPGGITGNVTETDGELTATGKLNVVDEDSEDTVLITVESVAVDNSSTFDTMDNPLDGATLEDMMEITPSNALDADPAAGSDFDWTFTSGNSGDEAFNFLAEGETLVLNYTLKATDSSGATTGESTIDTQAVTITITGANDAPVLGAPANNFNDVGISQLDNDGDLVSYLLNGQGSDVDNDTADAEVGIAVTGAEITDIGTGTGTGVFQYQLEADAGTTTWTTFTPTVGDSLLLRPEDRVRFLPDGANVQSGTITFRAWDQTTGNAGGTADTGTNGGTTPFSADFRTSSVAMAELIKDGNEIVYAPTDNEVNTLTVTYDADTNELVFLDTTGNIGGVREARMVLDPGDDLTIETGNEDDIVTIDLTGSGFSGNLTINGEGGSDTVHYRGSAALAAGSVASFTAEEITMRDSDLTTSDGTITLSATGGVAEGGDNFQGIQLRNSSLSSGSGLISLTGEGGDTGNHNYGVYVFAGSSIRTTAGGSIDIDGTGGGEVHGIGVRMDVNASVSTTGSGTLAIEGTGGGTINGDGILLSSGVSLSVAEGNMILNGVGSGSGGSSQGVSTVKSSLSSTGIGNIEITGTSSGSGRSNGGVDLVSTDIDALTGGGTGSVTIAGTGSSNGTRAGFGVQLLDVDVTTAATATLDITGTGNGTGIGNSGVILSGGTNLTGGIITLDGTGSATAASSSADGVVLAKRTDIVAAGALTITGTSGTGSSSQGVSASKANVSGGSIEITGVSLATGGRSNQGISLGNTTLNSGGALELTGTGGLGSRSNHGVYIAGGSLSASGLLTLLGTADGNTTGSGNAGVYMMRVNIGGLTGGSDITGSGGGSTSGLGNNNHGIFMHKLIGSITGLTAFDGTAGSGDQSEDEAGNFFPPTP